MKMLKQSKLLIFLAGLSFFISNSSQASNLLSQQQQEFKAASKTWTATQIPAGMPAVEGKANTRTSGTTGVSLLARNVDFSFVDGIGFFIQNLTASFEPLNPAEPVNLDDPRQFIIRVHSGSVIVTGNSLTHLFNQHILDYWPRPLNNMTVTTENNALIARGGLRIWNWVPPIGWLPAYLKGGIVLNQQNQMVYMPYDVRALGIPVKGLFDLLGIRLSHLITIHRHGVNLIGNALILDHRCAFPPPALEGTITSLYLDPAGLHLNFGEFNSAQFTPPALAQNSYLWLQSGDVKLYDTVVTNANILIKDNDPRGCLHFNLYDYREFIGRKNRVTMGEDGSMVMTLFTNE